MHTLLAFPSTAGFVQQVALALHERDLLTAWLTSYVYRDDGRLGRLLALAPERLRSKMERQLRRRAITAIPKDCLEERPFWEIVRTLTGRLGGSPALVDRIWDHAAHDFTRRAGRRLAHGDAEAIYAFEYTALEAFAAADRLGVAKILDLPSLNSRCFEAIARREQEQFPELVDPEQAYFDARFERRQARRDAEVAAADVIVTNSRLTRRSHIEAGADPEKVFAIPLGAPPPIRSVAAMTRKDPLRVIWAGSLSLGKGAHYFIEAWKKLTAPRRLTADIYGAITVPERVFKPVPAGVVFHGSVARPLLLEAFRSSDVLVFPTLSDGFGMVVTEAFSQGLPVITTDQAGACDLVEHGQNGLLIPAADSDAIVEALCWCLDNRQALAAMRGPALKTAQGWQWADYRGALITALGQGLTRAGYRPKFDSVANTP